METMKIYYKDGFYLDEAPEDAVEITLEQYETLLAGQAEGKIITTSENGMPILLEPKPQPIEQQQQFIRDKINTLRDEKSAGGVYVKQLGKWLDSDSKAQAKLLGLKATMDLVGDELTVDWTCADNSTLEGFNKAMLTAVISTILTVENTNHQVAKMHKEAMMKLDDPTSYDYSTGWVKNYNDYLAEQGNE